MILHVATERPEDPVEALTDFLLCKTFEEKYNEKGDKNLSLYLDTDDNNEGNLIDELNKVINNIDG